jgi:hypothetical protein
MSKYKGDVVLSAQVGKPVPAKDAFDTDHHVIQIRKDQFKELLRIRFDVLMHFGFSGLIQDADVHISGMKIDTAIIPVLSFVKSHVWPPLGEVVKK